MSPVPSRADLPDGADAHALAPLTRTPVSRGSRGVGSPIVSTPNCTACRHTQRNGIDAALANGSTTRKVGGAFGLSKSAVARHSSSCLPAKIARANVQRTDRLETADLLQKMVALTSTTEEQLAAAIASGTKPADVARLIREARENVGMLGRLLGSFADEGAKNVDNRVQIVALQSLSVDELRALTTSLRPKVLP